MSEGDDPVDKMLLKWKGRREEEEKDRIEREVGSPELSAAIDDESGRRESCEV